MSAAKTVKESEALKMGIDHLACLLEQAIHTIQHADADLTLLINRAELILNAPLERLVDDNGNLFYLVPAGYLHYIATAVGKAKGHG